MDKLDASKKQLTALGLQKVDLLKRIQQMEVDVLAKEKQIKSKK